MVNKILEFRGIRLHHLWMYLEELGEDEQVLADPLPSRYQGKGWSAIILSEETLTFTPTFKVNAVKIRFEADSEKSLEMLIKNFRYKTTRVGG